MTVIKDSHRFVKVLESPGIFVSFSSHEKSPKRA